MLKDKDTQPTLFQEDSPANHSALQEKEKEQMTIDTYGMKLLESSENVNLDGLLGKMLRGLLTSTTAWYSDRCKLTWKKKVSKSNVLLFQLQASVLGIKERESGLSDVTYPTPPQDSASERTKKYKQGGTPLTVAVRMFPTPTVDCEEGGEQSKRVEQTKSGAFILRKKNKPQNTFGAKLSDTMLYLEKKKIYNTPTTNDYKNLTFPKSQMKRAGSLAKDVMTTQNLKPGGKLNPNFVEFLMGYPMNWTKVDPTE